MIKRLAGCVGEYKKPAILAPVFVTAEVILEVIIPFLMAWMIDLGIDGRDIGMIAKLGIALAVCAMLSLFCGAMSGRYAAIASAGFAKNLRREMYHNIQEYSFSNIDKYSSAGLVTRLTTDVSNVQHAFQMLIRVTMRSPAMLLFSLVMAFGINLRISLIYLAALPVLGAGMYLIISRGFPLFQKVFKIYDRMNRVVQENLRGMRVVKSYVREEHETEKFRGVSGEIHGTFTKAERIMAFNAPLMQFVMYGCTLAISWLGARMIVSGTMSTGQLTSLFSYTSQILMSLMMLSMVFVMMTISRASAARIVEVLDERSDLQDGKYSVREVPDGSVRFENVYFSYAGDPDRLSLDGVSLDIRSGETVGIIGGTGSAKTTLVQLIPRLYDTTGGTVLVGGHDVREYDLHALRDAVAMVLQKNELFSGTIRENLRWGDKNASDEEIERVCRLAQADGFIREFPDGYDTYIEQGGTNVSGGQKQRLCIARAMLKKPKILILDDSTSAVDTKTDALIRQAMRSEIPGTTKLIIAQRISSVEDADKIIVMENGRIDGVGTHEQLLKSNAIYREVYDSQVKGGSGDGNDAA